MFHRIPSHRCVESQSIASLMHDICSIAIHRIVDAMTYVSSQSIASLMRCYMFHLNPSHRWCDSICSIAFQRIDAMQRCDAICSIAIHRIVDAMTYVPSQSIASLNRIPSHRWCMTYVQSHRWCDAICSIAFHRIVDAMPYVPSQSIASFIRIHMFHRIPSHRCVA